MNVIGFSPAHLRAHRQVWLECYHDGLVAEYVDCARAWDALTERGYDVRNYTDLAKLVDAVAYNFRTCPDDAALVAEGQRVLALVVDTLGGVPCEN